MGGHEHRLAGREVGRDLRLPVGQHPVDDELEALSAGEVGVGHVGVALVAHLAPLGVVASGGGGTSNDRRHWVNCSSPYFASVSALVETLKGARSAAR